MLISILTGVSILTAVSRFSLPAGRVNRESNYGGRQSHCIFLSIFDPIVEKARCPYVLIDRSIVHYNSGLSQGGTDSCLHPDSGLHPNSGSSLSDSSQQHTVHILIFMSVLILLYE